MYERIQGENEIQNMIHNAMRCRRVRDEDQSRIVRAMSKFLSGESRAFDIRLSQKYISFKNQRYKD